MSNAATHPNEVNDLTINIVNFNRKSVVNISNITGTWSIYESIFNNHCTCDLILTDAIHLLSRLPIVGEEYVVFQYKTAGVKGDGETFTLRTRSFRIYKISERTESTEGQQNYKLHGIDDHYFINEGHDINASFVGQNCIKACKDIFKTYFIDPEEFRPFDIQTGALFGYNKEFCRNSENTSSYISPGNTPIEVINYLKDEAVHTDTNNTSNYLFFQNIDGYHLVTLSELKGKDRSFAYFVKDGAVKSISSIEEKRSDSTTTSLRNSVLDYQFKKSFDTLKNIDSGMYGNRVVAIDLLTKKFDERIFNYNTEWPRLSPIESGLEAAKLSSEDSLHKQIGSTQTRFIATELLTSSIPTGNPTNFSLSEHPSYKQTPYFYPIDKSDPDEMKDKLTGTIKNEDADKRVESLVSNDSRIANPRNKHLKLNREVGSLASLDNIILDVVLPGNSDLTAGQIIEVYIPDSNNKDSKYVNFFNQESPRFLVTDVRHTYLRGQTSFITTATIVKDSYGISIEKQFELERDEGE